MTPFDKKKYSLLSEGLAVVERNLSHVRDVDSMRMEAEFYTSKRFSFGSVSGIDAIVSSQYGTSAELNEQGVGYPVLRLNEFDSAFIGIPAKFANLADGDFSSLCLSKDDVLICRTNGNPHLVGKSALVPRDYDIAFASYLFRVRPRREIINSATLVAFLNSKYGRAEIERYSMLGNQANFSPAKFRQIKIPLLGEKINTQVEELTYKAYQFNEDSKLFYAEAEDSLLSNFDLVEWRPSNDGISVRSFSDIVRAGRIDAEYFQPKFDELMHLLAQSELRNLGGDEGLVDIYKSIDPSSDYYGSKGIPFVRISDFSKFGVEVPNIRISEDVCHDCRRIKKDTILLTKDGSVGVAYKAECDLEMITSGAILHLEVKDAVVDPDYLSLVLNSRIVRMQAERDAGGSIIQHWKPSQIEKVKIPILPRNIQISLAEKVQESFRLRQESKRLLNLAKSAVEKGIEDGEEAAIKFIEEGV